MSQDDPCQFVKLENLLDSCLVEEPTRSQNSIKLWKHKYSREWQLLCFTPEQLRKTMPSLITCQLNSDVQELFKRKKKSTLIEIAISDESQILWIPDSLLIFNRDLSRLKIGVSNQSSNKVINPTLNLTLETQKFNKYKSSIDSIGQINKKLESGFLSPGTLVLQSGIKLSFNDDNEINLGVASAKYKWINNKEIRNQNEIEEFNGKLKLPIEGGFSANGNFESTINKLVMLEQSCRFFYPISKPRNPELEMRNKLSIKLAKHLKTSFLTVYSYSENRWPPSFWKAEFRLGYVIDN